ncbi:MAG: Maf family protein [Anaerolineae bacterium]
MPDAPPSGPVWILASQSPRRRALMAALGLPHEVVAADVPEDPRDGEEPQALALRLALAKARAVAARYPQRYVVAADTVVAVGRTILGKPADEAEAVEMLRFLRGRVHRVFTALAVLAGPLGLGAGDLAAISVRMRAYQDEEILAYVRTGDPLDKAGAYAIQHRGFRPVAELHGCYAGVLGFPLCHFGRTLRSLGLAHPADIPALCQRHTGIPCRVHPEVLAGDPLWRFPWPGDNPCVAPTGGGCSGCEPTSTR